MVRYNGGAQAGHNVVTPEGRHHTFSQIGAGSFVPGVRTFLSRHVVVHPTALLVEADAFPMPDVLARVRVSESALVVTPYHQEAGRARERARGGRRHGSCGVGVGETVEDSLAHPGDAVRAADLRDAGGLRRKTDRLRERLAFDLAIEDWIERATSIAGLVVPDATLGEWLSDAGAAVFEGAQGMLIDAKFGFHPYTSWTNCTPEQAIGLLSGAGAEVEVVGVLRTHMARHGPGPLPTETGAFRGAVFDHNRENEWQGPMRYGWFDATLARYAIESAGGVDALAITHVDAVGRMPAWRARLGGSYEDHPPDEGAALAAIERLLGLPVDIVSRGPRAGDVSYRSAKGWR